MWQPIIVLTVLAGTISASAAVQRSGGGSPVVEVRNGTYQGVYSPQYDQDFFLGIPYAQPPVGNLRFRQPQSLNTTWHGTKDAKQYSHECVGYGKDQLIFNVSEDCLTLNVVRPAGFEHQSLPVGFWIHGGTFINGGNADQRYNLSFIVQQSVKIGKPIIAVGVNYRLSAWGFLAADQLLGEGLTNFGLRDQRLALHWVQENVAAFGGDPTKVTIWGESAGAASVGFQLMAYGGRNDGLFRAAISESGGPIYYNTMNGTQQYQPYFDALVAQVNCSSSFNKVQCLRELPFSVLDGAINSTFSSIWNPVLDGDFIRGYNSAQLEKGQFVKVPLLIGTNSDEGASFTPNGINTTADFRAVMDGGRYIPDGFKDLLEKAYPDDISVEVVASLGNTTLGPPYGAQWRRAATYLSDAIFIAPRRRVSESWARYGVPTYVYRFNAIPALVPANIGVGHFKEIAFVFHNFLGVGYWPDATNSLLGLPQSYFDLSTLMSSSWASFIHDLDPNSYASRPKTLAQWPRYDIHNPQDFVFDANVTSHVESDTWRSEGINLINDNAVGIYRR